MAIASKAQNRPLSSPAAMKCHPAITPSLNSSRRRDSATDADSLDLDGCIHASMLNPDLWPAALEQGVGAVASAHGFSRSYPKDDWPRGAKEEVFDG